MLYVMKVYKWKRFFCSAGTDELKDEQGLPAIPVKVGARRGEDRNRPRGGNGREQKL